MDGSNDSTDRLNVLPGGKVTSEVAYRRSVFKELFWGSITGGVIAGVIGVPTTLLTNLLLCSHLQLDGQSHLVDLGLVLASTILGIVLLVILIPAIRKAAGQDDRKYEQSIPDLHWGAKFGGVLGTFIGTGTTIYLWSVWITVFRQDQIPLEAWQLVTGMCVSIGCILATGCMGAVAVVTGFILADKAKRFTKQKNGAAKNVGRASGDDENCHK